MRRLDLEFAGVERVDDAAIGAGGTSLGRRVAVRLMRYWGQVRSARKVRAAGDRRRQERDVSEHRVCWAASRDVIASAVFCWSRCRTAVPVISAVVMAPELVVAAWGTRVLLHFA
jgi:hypothetical protein